MSTEPAALSKTARHLPPWLRSRGFLGPVSAIGGVQLMAAMDGPIAVFALPRIQNELGLSDAARNWVVTAYMLTFGGFILLGGRLGDALGRKRTLVGGVALFTAASVLCGVAWSGPILVTARLVQGGAAAIVAPTCVALVATTFPKGPTRNAAMAAFGALASAGTVMGLVLGGMLTGVSWRLAFLVNLPIGLVVICLSRTMLVETHKERLRLDAVGAVLTTVIFAAVVFGLSVGPEQGWLSASAMGSGVVVFVALVAFAMVERTTKNPLVPFGLFLDRNRVAVFAAMCLARGVGFTLTVVIAVYVQNIMGYTPLAAGLSFIPFTIAMAIGTVLSSRLVMWFSPRVVVVFGTMLLLAAVLYGSTIDGQIPYFPDLLLPMTIGAIGIGVINVPLGLSLIANVGVDRIGPISAIALMLQTLGSPVVFVIIQVIITSRTLSLGGANGPVASMSDSQLNALNQGYSYGLLWLSAAVLLLGAVSLVISYTSQEVAHAQQIKKSLDPGVVGAL